MLVFHITHTSTPGGISMLYIKPHWCLLFNAKTFERCMFLRSDDRLHNHGIHFCMLLWKSALGHVWCYLFLPFFEYFGLVLLYIMRRIKKGKNINIQYGSKKSRYVGSRWEDYMFDFFMVNLLLEYILSMYEVYTPSIIS